MPRTCEEAERLYELQEQARIFGVLKQELEGAFITASRGDIRQWCESTRVTLNNLILEVSGMQTAAEADVRQCAGSVQEVGA